MADEKTHADSIRWYFSGAGADGGAQADPDAALGGYRSSTEVEHVGFTVTNPISNITIEFVGGANGTGDGTLNATGDDDLTWTPPGGSAGDAVTILNGETKILEAGGGDLDKYIRVTRTSVTALSGTATVTLTEQINNAVGMDNISSAEAAAGDDEYRCLFIKNESAVEVAGVTAYIGTLATQQNSDTGQLGASGAGTLATSGSFSDWPDTGFAHIRSNDNITREIIYYSSRTDAVLTVPSWGRGLLGTSAAIGASDDTLDAVPGIRIAKEAPGSQPTGAVQTIADEDTAPTGLTWSTALTNDTGVSVGDLTAGNIQALWIHRHVPAGAVATPTLRNLIQLAFDAA